MKRMILLALILAMSTGCARLNITGSKIVGDVVGLHRRVTLYSANGQPIKQYEGIFAIDTEDGPIDFVVNGRRVTINGTYTIEELQ